MQKSPFVPSLQDVAKNFARGTLDIHVSLKSLVLENYELFSRSTFDITDPNIDNIEAYSLLYNSWIYKLDALQITFIPFLPHNFNMLNSFLC